MADKGIKKILGVVGSPRKNGNTHILVPRIIEGSKERGAETEIIFLNDLNIRECDGWDYNLGRRLAAEKLRP